MTKSISAVLAAAMLSAVIAMSSTAPAEAGPVKDALKQQAKKAAVSAKFWGHVGVQLTKCVAGRIVHKPVKGCAK